MKFEQRRFSVFPSIVPAGKPITITIKGHGDFYRFFDDVNYLVKIVPKERRDYVINEDFDVSKQECHIIDAVCNNGILSFEYCFEDEQEWAISVMAKNGHDHHFNKWRSMFKDVWNLRQWDSFMFDFRIYSLLPDLYDLCVFKGDLHTHTEASDGNDTPELFCANYRGFGYDFLAITDHYEYSSSLRAIDKMAELDTNFTVFPGEEVHVIPSCGRFHIVNFNGKASINKKIKENYEKVKSEVFDLAKNLDGLSVRDAQEVAWTQWITNGIRAVGGIAIYAHPYWTYFHSYNCPTHITTEVLKRGYFDAYEALNGANPQENNLNSSLYYQLRAEGIHIPIVGSTDAHIATDHGSINCAVNSTYVFAKSAGDIPQAILDLNSTAASHAPGQSPYVHGNFRLVKYTYFLLDNYFPMHDELCKASGILISEYFKGNTELKTAIKAAEKVIAEFEKSFFGK